MDLETERAAYVKYRDTYMLIGDLDKPFHLCECACDECESWRRAKGRPTHAELRAMPPTETK